MTDEAAWPHRLGVEGRVTTRRLDVRNLEREPRRPRCALQEPMGQSPEKCLVTVCKFTDLIRVAERLHQTKAFLVHL